MQLLKLNVFDNPSKERVKSRATYGFIKLNFKCFHLHSSVTLNQDFALKFYLKLLLITMTVTSYTNPNLSCRIKGITEPIIDEYFIQLNNANFSKTAALFTEQGNLYPPFGKVVQGKSAIAQYLQKEAVGMKFYPEWGEITFDYSNNKHYQIQGKVTTHQFTVNVSWLFQLSSTQEISVLEIKLMASLKELAQLKRI